MTRSSSGPRLTPDDLTSLFDSQVDTLIANGYPAASGLTETAFRRRLAGLRPYVSRLKTAACDLDRGSVPFVIVVTNRLITARQAMVRVKRMRKSGHVAMQPVTPEDFNPIASVRLPEADAYLLVDIDRGRETLNVRPEDALRMIRKKRRSPLTIEEGIALVTHFPGFLMKNNCFSLLASRRSDQRVPAIWIDGSGRPKLGWCWDRNPHTWLGSASCRRRIGPRA